MKLGITERQLKLILSKQSVIDEEETAPPTTTTSTDSTPSTGTSSAQGGGTGYPSVGKWESGITRGPSNQIGVTKWSDVVGSSIKRGKANPLK
jgi:hypothetical protein